jgi:hypothetical protein
LDVILFPLNLGGLMTFGRAEQQTQPPYEMEYYPADGWVHTDGLNGVKTWNGSFYGNIYSILIIPLHVYYGGVTGFTGIKINNFFQGSALWVKIGPTRP